MEEYALEMEGSVSLRVKKGTVHAVLTENSMEAERLTALLTGLIPLRGGKIRLNGNEAVFHSPHDALAQGVGAVYRRGGMAEGMTLLDHVRLASGMPAGRKRARAAAEAMAEKYGLKTEWDIPAEEMLSGDRFRGELLRLILEEPDILILEEPASRLTVLEMEETEKLLRRLTLEGKTVLIMTSGPETAALADERTVPGDTREWGKALPPLDRREIAVGSVTLEVRNLTVDGPRRGQRELRAISFEARTGEITAVTGMPGSGQKPLAAALTGMTPLALGRIRLNGQDITGTSVGERTRLGIGFAPGMDFNFGFSRGKSAAENMALRRYRDPLFQENGFQRRREMRRYADILVDWEEFPDARDLDDLTPAEKQRCAFSREMEKNPDLLIALNPGEGMNRREAREIHNRLMTLRNSRRAVLMINEDPREAFEAADRILVLRQGELVGEFEREFTTLQELGLYMTGDRWKSREETFDEE